MKAASFVTSLFAASAFAMPALAQTPPKPKLIVAISVDQLSTDIFNEYRATFTGGLKRLTSGIVFPRGHQSHAATETCPAIQQFLLADGHRALGSSPMIGRTQHLNARPKTASQPSKSIALKNPVPSAATPLIRKSPPNSCASQRLETG